MSLKIYKTLQKLVPELNHSIPSDSNSLEDFSAWINQKFEIFHYIELTEYFDNGIEDDFFFKRFNVNAEQLQGKIETEIAILFEHSDEDYNTNLEDSFEEQIDVIEQTENILFDNIRLAASQHKLSLLVVYRENPYWLLVPTTNEDELNQIVDEFNQAFNDDGDLNMAIYS